MAKHKKQKEPRPIGLGKILLLAMFCFLIAESIACYIFAPALFHRIADPIAEKTVALAKLGKEKAIALASKTQKTIAAWAEQAEQAAQAFKESLEPKPELPAPAAGNTKQIGQPQSDLVIEHDGYYTNPVTKDITLTGGNVDILYFEQSAPAWKDQLYGSDPIGTHGCGPTAMAMVISSLTDYRVDPTVVANWSVQNGYYSRGGGSYHALIPAAARAYGLTVTSATDRTVAGLTKQLQAGNLLVILVRQGHFTTSGHFMIVRGVSPDGKFMLADPQSFENSIALWDPNLIVRELAGRDGDGGPVWIIGSGNKS
ncbi:MAG: C39 family peptidase [Butyricicoccus pullicaecorum]|nr:C39 family peptidase [Butyricicoccus pullicaecorum]